MSPKEIALQILNPDSDFPAWEDIESLANAYLELEKKNLSLTQAVENYHAQLNRWDRERIDAGYEQIIFELKEENEKLKKSREVLRKALEFYGNWINSPDGIMHRSDCEAIFVHSPLEKDKNGIIVAGKKAREALKADNEIMEGK